MATLPKVAPLNTTKAPNLLIAPVEYNQAFQDQLSNALRQYFSQLDNFVLGANNNFDITYRNVIIASEDYVMSAGDSIVLVDSTTSVQIHLPLNATRGNTCTIKDAKGNFASSNCTVLGTIDNVANLVMNVNYESRTFVYNGTSWNIIGY